jgi:hypothetical protein
MAGYTRQSVADIINGQSITAPPLNSEFNQLAAAFEATTGHMHTGGTGDAPLIPIAISVSGYLGPDNGGVGGKNNVTATTDPSVIMDAAAGYAPGSVWINTVSQRVFVCTNNSAANAQWSETMLVYPNNVVTPKVTNTVDLGTPAKRYKDIQIDGVGYIDTVNADNVNVTANLDVNGLLDVVNVSATGTASLGTSVTIGGGAIENTAIGQTTANGIRGTVVQATTGFSGNLTGAVTGNVTGNVVGNVTGTVTGGLTGNVTAVTGSSTFNNVEISGALNMDASTGATITNLSNPVNPLDAATKQYVDTAVGNVIDAAPAALNTLNELAAALNDDANYAATVSTSLAAKVHKTGDSMTGALNMTSNKITSLGTPTLNSDASNKSYVDQQDALQVSKTGDTMTGILDMSANRIIDVASPAATNDAANKAYVDSILGSATSAASSAALASSSQAAAATSANLASSSANNAASSATSASNSLNTFQDLFLGSYNAAPSTSGVSAGAIYYNTTNQSLYLLSGGAWVSAVFDTAGAMFGSNNLADVSDSATARTNLGVPSTSEALSVANDLSDLSNPVTARTNLGVSIGSDVQAYDANLTTFATTFNLPVADGEANNVLKTDGAGNIVFGAAASGGGTASAYVVADASVADYVYKTYELTQNNLEITGTWQAFADSAILHVTETETISSDGNYFETSTTLSGDHAFYQILYIADSATLTIPSTRTVHGVADSPVAGQTNDKFQSTGRLMYFGLI